MAIIGKIRKRSGLLIGAIGVAMVLFIAGDLLSSGSSLFGGPEDQSLGEIDGTSISRIDFENEVERVLPFYLNYPPNQQRAIAQNLVWQRIMADEVYNPRYEALGLTVTGPEIGDLINGTRPSPVITNNQSFVDPQTRQPRDGYADPNNPNQLNLNLIAQQLQALGNSERPEDRHSFVTLENNIIQTRLLEKYSNLVKKAMYVTSKEAEKFHDESNRKYKVKLVSKSYAEIDESDIEVSESEIESYYNEHKEEAWFRQTDPVRSVDYVVWDIEPTEDDILTEQEKLEKKVKDRFAKSPNVQAFLQGFSQNFKNGMRDVAATDADSLFLPLDTTCLDAEDNTVFGPFRNGKELTLVKVVRTFSSADTAEARHIQMPLDAGRDSATVFALADSLMTALQDDISQFEVIAAQYSNDVSTSGQGGNMGRFSSRERALQPALADSIFSGPTGKLMMVKTPVAVHIVEVLDQTEQVKRATLATAVKEVTPGKNTMNKAFKVSSKFISNHNSTEKFLENEEKEVLHEDDISDIQLNFANYENPSEILTWIREAEAGTVALQPFEMGNSIVVAHLASVVEEGVKPLELRKVQDYIKAQVIQEKKADKIVEMASGKSGINEIAAALSTAAESQELTFAQATMPNGIQEPKVMGSLSTLSQGSVSSPIKGNSGVYYLELEEVIEPVATVDYNETKKQMHLTNTQSLNFTMERLILKLAQVKDRRQVYYGRN